jgi:hypothetical protein
MENLRISRRNVGLPAADTLRVYAWQPWSCEDISIVLRDRVPWFDGAAGDDEGAAVRLGQDVNGFVAAA